MAEEHHGLGPRRIVIITGMSGAGLNTARTTFQDLGFEVVDNLPLDFVDPLLAHSQHPAIALGIDVRTRGFSAARVRALLDELNARPNTKASLLFLECGDDSLLQRFSETRRRHPLAADRPVRDGLSKERAQLLPLKQRADHLIDTSRLSSTELRHIIGGHYPAEPGRGLLVQVMSFSYRQGVPREADLVFDARFLRNPHYDDALRPHTGQQAEVGAYIAKDEAYAPFFTQLTGMISTMLPGLQRSDRTYLTIAFGCTGGKHRSVYLAEQMASWLKAHGVAAQVRHRELERLGLVQPSAHA